MRTLCAILTISGLLITAHRLPAPIQEDVSPTPSPSVSSWQGELYPETRTQALKTEDVRKWDVEKMRYAINEMYARGGYDFRVPEIKQIFMRVPWYRERLVNGRTQDEAMAHLSSLERANLELLQNVRREKGSQ